MLKFLKRRALIANNWFRGKLLGMFSYRSNRIEILLNFSLRKSCYQNLTLTPLRQSFVEHNNNNNQPPLSSREFFWTPPLPRGTRHTVVVHPHRRRNPLPLNTPPSRPSGTTSRGPNLPEEREPGYNPLGAWWRRARSDRRWPWARPSKHAGGFVLKLEARGGFLLLWFLLGSFWTGIREEGWSWREDFFGNNCEIVISKIRKTFRLIYCEFIFWYVSNGNEVG